MMGNRILTFQDKRSLVFKCQNVLQKNEIVSNAATKMYVAEFFDAVVIKII